MKINVFEKNYKYNKLQLRTVKNGGDTLEQPQMADLELLERSCNMYLLRYIGKNPGKNQSELMSTEGKNLSTKNKRLRELLHDFYLFPENKGRQMTYYLTEDAMEIVEHLDAIAEIIKRHESHIVRNDGTNRWVIDPEDISEIRGRIIKEDEQ